MKRRAAGFSLIELMVSMAIGLVVTVAIAAVMVGSESDKRGSTAVNDINQSGSYVAYVLDRQIRSAGSGFAQAWTKLAGCQLFAKNTSGGVLPHTFAAGKPYAGWTTPVSLAPVVIGAGLAGAGGDLVMVMAGAGGLVEVPPVVLPSVTASVIRLNNTLGFRSGDLVAIADPAVPGSCLVQQVTTFSSGATNGSADQSLPLGGAYAGGVSGGPGLTSYGQTTTAVLAQLGNVNNNLPQFSVIGVDTTKNTLVSSDLLPAAASAIDDDGQAIADGVVQMNAVYGTVPYPFQASPGPGITWHSATDSGYAPADLLPNPPTTASQNTLHGIVAIRIGLVLRTAIGEQKPVAGVRQVLFKDLPTTLQVNAPALATAPPYYRYRTVEMTIPLRNVLLAP